MSVVIRTFRALTLLAALAAAAVAAAQSAAPAAVQAFGNFKRMSHTGDTAAKVALRELPAKPGNYAVGALAGLRGEIVMLDGKLLVTRGHSAEGRTEPPAADDAATLLALANVEAWHVVTGAACGGHGSAHAQGHAANRVFDERNAKGVMLGFYSGEALAGAISHPGERFHVHYANGDASRSGHVDAYAVRGGAVLSQPAH